MAKQHQSSTVHFRTIDGTDNNGTFNVANSDFTRSTPANFADGISTLVEGPNPRMISNVVVGEGDAAVPNPEGLSAFMYAWGQFIDHDLDLSTTDRVNHIDVQGPDGTLNIITRATIDPNTGAGTNVPATAINTITGWLDASMIYGSNATVAASLRLPDGHLKSIDGNLPTTPDGTQFLAGDVRAQENPGLTALQTLFLREHNWQVDQLSHAHHDWTGDQLYDQARAIVGAEIAQITYGEFLPHLLGPDAVAPYKGFDPHVDPRITEEFAGAAFRFGHSIVSSDTEQIDNNGESITGELELRDVFFQPPDEFNSGAGADGFLRHLASDPSQAMDARIVEDLRNFLTDSPGAMDLAAINIQRGHDLGLNTLNDTREALGLDPYTSFGQITDDLGTVQALQQAFGNNVDAVDLWTGGLSEKHPTGSMVGETFQKIIGDQFDHLRAGDQFWFERQGFDADTLAAIKGTTLSSVIERNTDTASIQDDAFVFAVRHTSDTASEDPNAPQLVIGVAGGPAIVGGPQGDTLVSATDMHAMQFMTGSTGGDQFVVSGKVTVTDFNPAEGDKLVAQQHDPKVNFKDGNAIVHSGNDTITLEHVTQAQLQGHDWWIS